MSQVPYPTPAVSNDFPGSSPSPLSDLETAARTDLQALTRAILKARQVDQPVTPQKVYECLRGELGAAVSTEALYRLVINLAGEVDWIDELQKATSNQGDENARGNAATSTSTTVFRLLELLREPIPGLSLWSKAAGLAKMGMMDLVDFQVLCDMRPVFDDTRTSIVAIVPLVTVRMVSSSAETGEPTVTEVRCAIDQLPRLQFAVSNLESKLAAIAAFAKRNQLPVPFSAPAKDEPT